MGSCISSPKFTSIIVSKKHEDSTSDKNSCETNHDQLYNKTLSTTSSHKNHPITPQQIIYYILKASTEDTYLPIYLKKNDIIIITVTSRWLFISERGFVDFSGYHNTLHSNHPIGQLCCRVQGGKSFPITNSKSSFQSDTDGQLIFYPNLNNDYKYSSSNPIGELGITIEGAKQLTYDQINIENGWNLTSVIPRQQQDFLSKNEGEVIDLINKVRANPQRFIKEYFNMCNGEDMKNYLKEAYHFLEGYTTVPILQFNNELTLTAKDHCEDLSLKGFTGHLGSGNDIVTIKQRIMKHRKSLIEPICYGENCLYGMQMPCSIIIEMLVNDGMRDKANRMNILNENYTHVGVSIMKHLTYKWVCVIVFSKDNS